LRIVDREGAGGGQFGGCDGALQSFGIPSLSIRKDLILRLPALVFLSLFCFALRADTAHASDRSPDAVVTPHGAGLSENRLYRVSWQCGCGRIPLNRMHRWRLKVTNADGARVPNANIIVTGGTVEHRHVMPTSPRAFPEGADGRYRVEGIKFDRQGAWQLRVTLNSAAGQDHLSIPIQVDTAVWADWHDGWSDDERTVLKSLWIGSLPPPPADPTNGVADNPAAAAFGHRLFFDKRLSHYGTVSCASCHLPERAFTDGRKRARGTGDTNRNTPTIIGVAYMPWLFWDGRKDSLWSQALGPLENPLEHATNRRYVVGVIRRDPDYRNRYTALFGDLPKTDDLLGTTRAFANLGKAIAAYERALMPAPSKFDRYVAALLANQQPHAEDQLNLEELSGLKVFIADNQGQCVRCHNGPMFTDNDFHNIGTQLSGDIQGEQGRIRGIKLAHADETIARASTTTARSKIALNLLSQKWLGANW
jgi:cytochrome c peroxidase